MDGRRRPAFGGAEQNPAYRPARPPPRSAGPAHAAAQRLERPVELLAAPPGQVGFLLVEQGMLHQVYWRKNLENVSFQLVD